jgi:hypothetical protein
MNLCNLVKQVTVQVLTGQIRSFLRADNNTRDRLPPLRAAILAEPSEFANKPPARERAWENLRVLRASLENLAGEWGLGSIIQS